VSRAAFGGQALARRLGGWHDEVVRVEMSPEAEEFVRGRGGQVWVWAARPMVCCWSTPSYMHAATAPPSRLSGFTAVDWPGLQVWCRIPGGRRPDVLEICLRGRRRPRVEAYWDGCAFAL
jgi:hypothetical protein